MLRKFASSTITHLGLGRVEPPIDLFLTGQQGMARTPIVLMRLDTEMDNGIPPIQITIVSRLGSRRVLNEARLVDTIKSTYGDRVAINVVHFETMTFPEQVKAVR